AVAQSQRLHFPRARKFRERTPGNASASRSERGGVSRPRRRYAPRTGRARNAGIFALLKPPASGASGRACWRTGRSLRGARSVRTVGGLACFAFAAGADGFL